MNFRRSAVSAMAIVILAAGVGSGTAQTSKGTLAGTARDKTGAVIASVTLTVTNQDTGEKRTVTTKADGGFRIDSITPGKYTLVAAGSGFATYQAKDVTVTASSITSYDVTLTVGSASTDVLVEANQGTINTDNGTLTGVVNAIEIDKLPIFSLNPIELATTLPGVQTVSNGGGFSNGVDIQVNGARPRANNFLLDGQEINDVGIGGQAFQPQIPDIFDSLNLISNSASAEFGRAGGGIVNLTTKQGTNTIHGTVFERYAGSGLNSVPGIQRGTPGFERTRQNTHSYGFTGGGAILKNKLFVFGALELQRTYGNITPGINLLPDSSGYATLQTITGAPAAQVQLLDQYLNNGSYLTKDILYAATTTKNVGALPGCPAGGCVISFSGYQRPAQPINSPDTQWMYRVDYHPWEKDSFSFRYLHDRTSLTPDFFNNSNALAGFDTQQGGPTELGAGQWTHIFSPNLENEFRVSEARLSFTFSPTAATVANPLTQLPTLSFSTVTAGGFKFPNLGPNQNFPQGRKESLYQFQDTVGWTKGRHSFRFGTDIGRQLETDLVSQNAIGQLSFTVGGTGVSSLGNFLLNQLGPAGTATKTFGPTRVDPHGFRNGFFAQDDIKLTPDLTINVGVRYDFLTDPENSLQYPGIDVTNVFAPINTVVKIKGDYNNISPRIGFAYSPHSGGFFGSGKTVVRGGFGIFYDSTFSNILVNSAQSSPNGVASTLTAPVSTAPNGLQNATSLIPSITSALGPLNSVLSEASNLVNPQTFQYNLGVEQEVFGGNVLAIRYIGAQARKLFANQQYNYFQNGGGRLNAARGAVTVRGNYADSNYNSAEVDFTHNFSHGLLVRANYVYSKDLDDGSEVFTTFSTDTSYSADLRPGGRRQDYGPSAYDHRQYFSIAYVWSPKGLHSDNKVLDAAYGLFTRHWTLSGVSQLQSGAYTSYTTTGVDTNGDNSTANDRPIVTNKNAPLQSVGIDGHFVGGTPGTYYDLGQLNTTGNVVVVTPSQVHFLVPYGPQDQFLTQEIGRGSLQLPGTTTHNVAAEKGIGLKYFHLERATMLFRVEAQNVFNHNDGDKPDNDVLDAAAGFLDPVRQQTNRTVILWAKFQF